MSHVPWETVKYTQGNYLYEFTLDKPLTKCVITDTTRNLKGVGWSKLSDGDIYDSELGMRIAHSRAVVRLESKLLKYHIARVRSAT